MLPVMSQSPPPLPSAVLARVLKVSTFEGRTVLVIGGAIALGSALLGDWFGAVVCSLIAGAGAVELHGGSLLRNGQARGMNWLVRSQLLLLNIVLIYVAIQLTTLYSLGLKGLLSAEAVKGMLSATSAAGMSPQEGGLMWVRLFRFFYGTFALATLLFQGGMGIYYHRRRKIITEALRASSADHR